MSRAEALVSAFVVALATTIVVAYFLDQAGGLFGPLRMAVVCAFSGGFALWRLWPRATADDVLVPWLVLVGGVFTWLMWLASPSFLPLGTGPDLTHHLQLIRYIDEHWHLVREPGAERYLGEMTFYTPGSHLLASLLGAWSGTTGLHALQPLLSLVVALKIGIVALIARRMLPVSVPREPLSIAVSLTAFAAQAYLLGSFLQFAFVAQVVAELFALFAWWAVVGWQDDQRVEWMWLFGVSSAALFLTWPVLVGPPLFLLGLVTLLPSSTRPLLMRLRDAALGAALPVFIGAWFILSRPGWLQMAGTGGLAQVPRVAAYGSVFLIASTIGLFLCVVRVRARVTALFALAIVVQAGALWWVATSRHNTPYMAEKMFYLLLFVQAAAIAPVAGEIWQLLPRWRWHRALAWLTAVGMTAAVAASVWRAPRRMEIQMAPAITTPLERAGEWTRAHLPANCVEYLVADDEASYWLHLAVLTNPRLDARSADFDTYDLTLALVRWLTPNGLPYAIVELNAIPEGIRNELDVIATFDGVVLARRRSPSACTPRELPLY